MGIEIYENGVSISSISGMSISGIMGMSMSMMDGMDGYLCYQVRESVVLSVIS